LHDKDDRSFRACVYLYRNHAQQTNRIELDCDVQKIYLVLPAAEESEHLLEYRACPSFLAFPFFFSCAGMNGTSFFQYCSCRSTQTAWDSVVNDDRCSKTSLRLKLNSCGCASKMKLPIALDTVRSTNTDLTSKYPTKERVASRKKKALAIRYKHITLVANTCIR
jgi:hypothetical protein